MSAHTPGPWEVEQEEPYDLGIRGDGRRIAEVWMDDACRDLHHVNRADARLMAAAPLMLEALKTVAPALAVEHALNPSYGWSELRDIVKAAIAKAEGTNG